MDNVGVSTLERLPVIGEDPPKPEPPRSWLWLLFGAAAVVGLLAMLPGGTRLDTSSQVDALDASPPPSLSEPQIVEPHVAALQQADTAIETAAALVDAVNSADSERVIELLARTVPEPGLGSSEWPMLYGSVGWWHEDSLAEPINTTVVTDFVRYFRTIPGGVVIDDCRSETIDVVQSLVSVTCSYGAFGGMRGLMGDRQEAEHGEIAVVVQYGKVVDIVNDSAVNQETWGTLQNWIAGTNYERPFRIDRGGPFLPVYTAESAMQHAAVAMAYAESVGAEPLPFG